MTGEFLLQEHEKTGAAGFRSLDADGNDLGRVVSTPATAVVAVLKRLAETESRQGVCSVV